MQAELDSQALLAVTQQGLFFGKELRMLAVTVLHPSSLRRAAVELPDVFAVYIAAVAAGETYLARQAVAPGEPGRPEIAPTAIAVGGVAAVSMP